MRVSCWLWAVRLLIVNGEWEAVQATGQQDRSSVGSTGAVLPENGLYLHASSVIVNGGAVLFLGHSTAGKSTIAHLLSPLCPVLADDTVLAQRDASGQWLVTDGKSRLTRPPPAQQDYAGQAGTPLHACVRIHKGPALRHAPLAPIELAQCLMDAVMEVDVQRKCGRLDPKNSAIAPDAIVAARAMRGHWFHMAAEIARECPGKRIWFPRDADVKALKECLQMPCQFN